jgi:hypothetical protein
LPSCSSCRSSGYCCLYPFVCLFVESVKCPASQDSKSVNGDSEPRSIGLQAYHTVKRIVRRQLRKSGCGRRQEHGTQAENVALAARGPAWDGCPCAVLTIPSRSVTLEMMNFVRDGWNRLLPTM